ncbi:glycosyltransferase family 2 protein [Azospirillum agricola]|uniref:glycosyltransferase family 2 protein n=1 Tax=Azospirillum agricola TaxID=1720247 RepID=UPI000A0F3C00|nr:glycosyltransferase family A protein [Azospirillum agricola]SMH41869.1 Glycosyltransferase involved in cell wall bisynthesis [Azospirillum lipoferum]
MSTVEDDPKTDPGTDPTVSVIVPCHNSVPWLAETVASLTAQTLRSMEIILVDDGSRDSTRALIGELVAANPAHRIRAVFQDTTGVGAARNRGIAMARGRYILPVDADDLIAPDTLEICAARLDADPAIGVVYTDREEFGDVAAVWPAGRFELERLKYFNQLSYCALYRKAVWEAVGGYRTNVDGFDDWDFWIASAALGVRGRHQPGAFLKHRKRGDSQMWSIIDGYDRLFATIILNNRKVYSATEVAAAETLLATGVAAPLFRSTRYVFMGHFLGKLPAPARRGETSCAS